MIAEDTTTTVGAWTGSSSNTTYVTPVPQPPSITTTSTTSGYVYVTNPSLNIDADGKVHMVDDDGERIELDLKILARVMDRAKTKYKFDSERLAEWLFVALDLLYKVHDVDLKEFGKIGLHDVE